jgi:hypothetical protein
VQERLKVGSRVRLSHDILEGEKGDTGAVLQIDTHERLTDSNVMVSFFFFFSLYFANNVASFLIILFLV